MKTIPKKKRMSALCYLPDGGLVCYHYGKVFILREEKEDILTTIPVNAWEKLLGWSRYAIRLFRFGIRAAIALDNETVIFSHNGSLFELCLSKGELSKGWLLGGSVRPLSFTMVNNIIGFYDGVYFGGYLGNTSKAPVSVYRRTSVDNWEVVYTFEQGEINHIHNIISDSYRNCLWVLSGDFGKSAAIWKVTDNFSTVERVVCNNQKYRACVGYAIPEGLLYATDSPFSDNYVYLLDVKTMETKELFPIDGSCIYGCKWKDRFVFSSTVEGDGRNTTKWDFCFGRKRGVGIKDNFVHMYMGNIQSGFHEIYKEEKDCMPYYTFQFGAFKFPAGENNSDRLYFQPIATKKNDLKLVKMG